MTITYTNRRQDTYFLHRRKDKNGRLRYVFSKTRGEGAIKEIPDGYEIFESVHARVSLRKLKPPVLTRLEEKILAKILAQHTHLQGCRMQQEGQKLVFYEPRTMDYGDGFPFRALTALSNTERYLDYDATLRFVLVDKTKRTFRAERMCYRSFVDGWMTLAEGSLKALAETYLPHLRRESFYELWEGLAVPKPEL